MRFHTKRCAGRSKKQAEALAARDVVHPRSQCRVCGVQGDVLKLYEQAYDPARPQVCYDEWQ